MFFPGDGGDLEGGVCDEQRPYHPWTEVADLSLARGGWAVEKPAYEALCRHVRDLLEQELRERELLSTISARSKDTASLLKKLIKKGYSYDEITDKAGVRVVVRFRQEIALVEEIVEWDFHVIRKVEPLITLNCPLRYWNICEGSMSRKRCRDSGLFLISSSKTKGLS